jgi:large repetitive protein
MSRTVLALPFVLLLACDSDEPGDPPEAPRELGVAAVTGGAHLTWMDASDDEDEFTIERKGETGAFAELGSVPFDTTQYHDATATTGTWVYRVAATNDAGEGWSEEVSVTIP